MIRPAPITLPIALLLAGCSLTPPHERPAAPVPPSWPAGDAYLAQEEAALPALGWRDVYADPRLAALVEQALDGNRDLRAAAAGVAAARARYRIRRADRLPVAEAGVSGRIADGGDDSLSADIAIPAFEIDLFGRVAALAEAERERWFATEAGARALRIAIAGDIADAWIAHAQDASLLAIARETAASARRTVTLTRARLDGGIAPRTDLRQAEQVLATAEADIARLTTALAQDANALDLLAGAVVDRTLLPTAIEDVAGAIREAPAGLDSRVLLRRPDIIAAEHRLRAANAEIGAARAALFPTISLTGLAGFASDALGSLFSGGSFGWSAGANAGYGIFRGGAARAGVEQGEAQRDATLAQYEGAIQTAFREVADALARTGTYAGEERAVRALVNAADDNLTLADARYRGGIDAFLARLDAERSLYTARRTLVQTLAGRARARVALYRALGAEETQPRN